MICAARDRFATVIEECQIAGLETGAIPRLLGQMYPELADSMRPEVRQRLEAGRPPLPLPGCGPGRREVVRRRARLAEDGRVTGAQTAPAAAESLKTR